MKWLFYAPRESKNRAKVTLIYYEQPPKELTNIGNHIVVNELEEPEVKSGKTAVLYCNPETREVWYEYVDRPLTVEELLQLQGEKLDLIMMNQLEGEGII